MCRDSELRYCVYVNCVKLFGLLRLHLWGKLLNGVLSSSTGGCLMMSYGESELRDGMLVHLRQLRYDDRDIAIASTRTSGLLICHLLRLRYCMLSSSTAGSHMRSYGESGLRDCMVFHLRQLRYDDWDIAKASTRTSGLLICHLLRLRYCDFFNLGLGNITILN